MITIQTWHLVACAGVLLAWKVGLFRLAWCIVRATLLFCATCVVVALDSNVWDGGEKRREQQRKIEDVKTVAPEEDNENKQRRWVWDGATFQSIVAAIQHSQQVAGQEVEPVVPFEEWRMQSLIKRQQRA